MDYTALIAVTRTPLSSTSINVRWSTPPPNSDRLPLTYHVNYTYCTTVLYYASIINRILGIISISYVLNYPLSHSVPGLVTLTPLNSTSINVRWSASPNSDRLPLTYHINYTGMSRSTSDITLTLTGLHPYKEYTISVQAGNKGGLSVPVTGTARTYSDSELVVF